MQIKSSLPILTDGDTYKVTSPFGYRIDPFTGRGNAAHKGIDLVLWRGFGALSAIGSAWDGVVTTVASDASRGNYVIIDHGGGLESHYYHLAAASIPVSEGDFVTAGEKIGCMGSTGASTGAHLHFQVEMNGTPIDPLPYITGEDMIEADGTGGDELDNTPAEWAEEAILWARENGILYGDERGNLHLHEPVTCERMLVFLHRVYKLTAEGDPG